MCIYAGPSYPHRPVRPWSDLFLAKYVLKIYKMKNLAFCTFWGKLTYIEMLSISIFICIDFPFRSLFNWDISEDKLKNPNNNDVHATKEAILF